MKTQLLNFVISASLLLLFACAKNLDPSAWTDERFNQAVSSCSSEIPSSVSRTSANNYCTCYFNAVKGRWNFSSYSSDPYSIELSLEKDGTVNSCLATM